MDLFGIFRARGDLSAPGPHIIAGVIPAREELPPFNEAVQAMRSFCLPRAGNIYNIEYHRLHRGTKAACPPRGTRVSPDAPPSTHSQPPACATRGERPAFVANNPKGATNNESVSSPGLSQGCVLLRQRPLRVPSSQNADGMGGAQSTQDSVASPQSGISQTHTQSSNTDTARRSVQQPGFPDDFTAPAAPQHHGDAPCN